MFTFAESCSVAPHSFGGLAASWAGWSWANSSSSRSTQPVRSRRKRMKSGAPLTALSSSLAWAAGIAVEPVNIKPALGVVDKPDADRKNLQKIGDHPADGCTEVQALA